MPDSESRFHFQILSHRIVRHHVIVVKQLRRDAETFRFGSIGLRLV